MHNYYKREGEGRVFPFELQFGIVGMKMLPRAKNAQDLLHLKTSLWFLIYGRDPKATRYYETNPQGQKQ